MRYLVPLEKPRCQCGRRATVEAFNRYNASCGKFCKRCGERLLREAQAREAQAQERGERAEPKP